MRISDWSSDVCSSDLAQAVEELRDARVGDRLGLAGGEVVEVFEARRAVVDLALLHRVGLDHLLVSAISQHAEGVVGVRAEGLDGGDVLGHALHVPGHHVVDGALAELLLVVEVGVAVTEVDDARVAAAVGAGAGAAELPGLDLVGAPGGAGLPRLAQELGYPGIVHARPGLGDVAGAVEQRAGFGTKSEARREGKECVSMCISRGSMFLSKKTNKSRNY